jgi:hypothetical protein
MPTIVPKGGFAVGGGGQLAATAPKPKGGFAVGGHTAVI